MKLMFHSAGMSVRLFPTLLRWGLYFNPVHINSTGMEPATTEKKDFGDSLASGRGVDTQKVLPSGTVKEVADDVRRNIGDWHPGICIYNGA